jgi:hypothetical protein
MLVHLTGLPFSSIQSHLNVDGEPGLNARIHPMRAYIHPTCDEEVEAKGSAVEHLVVEAADVKLGAQFFWARSG